MGRLEGKVAIVTGGSQGIGAAYCKKLAEEGAKIVVADLVDGSNVVGVIEQAGGEAVTVETDVASEESNNDMVAAAVDAFGRVDILVANAGLYTHLERKPSTEETIDEWDQVYNVNIKGVWLGAKAAIPEMKKNGYGKIVNIASGTVFKGTPMLLHYVSSKGAMVAFTRALAREVGDDGICVNALAPGLTMSEKVLGEQQWTAIKDANAQTRSIKRDELPEDLVGAMLFLCSSDSDFMTGQTLVVDGGSAMH